MITDLLFYTVTAIQRVIALAMCFFVIAFCKLFFNNCEYEEKNRNKGLYLSFYLFSVATVTLIFITTVKPYFLAMIGGLV